MKETFDLYKSGKPRTIRLKAWGLNNGGKLHANSFGTPLVARDRDNARRLNQAAGGKVIELEVTIKAAPKAG